MSLSHYRPTENETTDSGVPPLCRRLELAPSVDDFEGSDAPIVMKFGGTSVANIERIQAVAKRCVEARRSGKRVVVVVSAMAGETNRLLALAQAVARVPDGRELDALAATGEQVTAALTALAIQELGEKAVSFLGHQIPIRTDSAFTRSRIESVDTTRIEQALSSGAIVVVAGFQGADASGNITTIGRGGSDTTAIAVAVALGAAACEIYTDVDGIYEGDPSTCAGVKKIEVLTGEEMLELASLGAKVLQTRSVEIAVNHGIDVHVRSTFADREGTWVRRKRKPTETLSITGITCDRSESRVHVQGIAANEAACARLLGPLTSHQVPVDMLVIAPRGDGRADVWFNAPTKDIERYWRQMDGVVKTLDAQGVRVDHEVAKVSLVGIGMRSYPTVAPRILMICAQENMPVRGMAVSEIRASVLVSTSQADMLVQALHAEFFAPSADLFAAGGETIAKTA